MGTYYGPEWLRPYAQAFWYPKDWLSGTWSKNDQEAFDTLYQFDFFRGQFDKILNERNRSNYFDRFGIDYSMISDPRNAVGSAPLVSRSAAFRVSDNIKRLYR